MSQSSPMNPTANPTVTPMYSPGTPLLSAQAPPPVSTPSTPGIVSKPVVLPAKPVSTTSTAPNPFLTPASTQVDHPTFKDFKASNLMPDSCEQKKAKAANGAEIVYYAMVPNYNMGTPEQPRLVSFMLEGCPVRAPFGLKNEVYMGKEKVSLMLSLDDSQPNIQLLIKNFDDIQERTAVLMNPHQYLFRKPPKSGVLPDLTEDDVKTVIYRPRDEKKRIIVGKKPSMYVDITNRGLDKTKFLTPEGKEIPWDYLTNVEMTLIPLFRFRRIYASDRPPINYQMDLFSAVVISIESRSAMILQLNTIERLQKESPNLVSFVTSQLANIEQERKEQKEETKGEDSGRPKEGNKEVTNTPTHNDFLPAGPPQNSNNVNLTNFMNSNLPPPPAIDYN